MAILMQKSSTSIRKRKINKKIISTLLILLFVFINKVCFAENKPNINSMQISNKIIALDEKQQVLNTKFEDLKRDFESSYKALIKLTDINAHSAQMVIWIITGLAALFTLLSYVGISNMVARAKETIEQFKSDSDSVIQKTKGSLGEIENSKKQMEELKQYLTLAAQLKEITPERIEQQISDSVKSQVDHISEQLNKLKTENLPQDADIYKSIGDAHYKSGNYPDAIAAYRKALTINPNTISARFRLALTYSKIKDYPGAIREYEFLQRLYPNYVSAIENLAELYLIEGEYGQFDTLIGQVYSSPEINKAFEQKDINIMEFHKLCSLALREDRRFTTEFDKLLTVLAYQKAPYISKSWTFDINTVLQSKLKTPVYDKLINLEKILQGQKEI